MKRFALGARHPHLTLAFANEDSGVSLRLLPVMQFTTWQGADRTNGRHSTARARAREDEGTGGVTILRQDRWPFIRIAASPVAILTWSQSDCYLNETGGVKMVQIFGTRAAKIQGQPEGRGAPEEPPEPKASGADTLIQEYRERIAQALETEKNGLRAQAEKYSSQIIARAEEQSVAMVAAAREEAQQIIAASRRQAAEDSSKRIADAQQEAERLVKEAERRAEDKAREKTKTEAQRIITKAQEEASKTLEQARQEAKTESDKITADSRREAARVVADARESAYAEARQETERVVFETGEKTADAMIEVIERGREQAKSEFARVASGAKSKAEGEITRLLNQVTKSLEQIIGETEGSIEADFDDLAAIVAETRERLQPDPDASGMQPSPSAKDAADAPAPASPASRKTRIALPIGDRKRAPAKDKGEPRLYNGCLNLAVSPPFDRMQLRSIQSGLAQVPGLRILSTGGYTEGEQGMMKYTIDLEQPTPLLEILRAMPAVGDVASQKGDVAITLKTDDDSEPTAD